MIFIWQREFILLIRFIGCKKYTYLYYEEQL